MTGPRDMKPWEVYAYSRYRTNLRHTHGKPDTRKGRELHKIERWFLIWPAHAYIRWAQRKRLKPANTTAPQVGAIFNPPQE